MTYRTRSGLRARLVQTALAAVWIVTAGSARGADFVVDTEVDSVDAAPGDGVCADALGRCSLRAAIIEANALAGADTVSLPPGTFALSIAGTGEDAAASGDLDVTDDLRLSGAGTASSVIDAGAIDRVLDLRPGAARTIAIADLTLRKGRIVGSGPTAIDGAGLTVGRGVSVDLQRVTIRDNVVSTGLAAAGIGNRGCLTGRYLRVLDNVDVEEVGAGSAIAGGIVTAGADSCLVLADCELDGNRGDQAGAIYVDDQASLTLRRCLLSRNSARFAGAIQINVGGEVRLEDSTISSNAGNPGAILNDGFTLLQLVNSTVTGNHGSNLVPIVGGIQDVHGGFGLTVLTNSILSGNGPGFLADNCSNAHAAAGGNIVGVGAGCQYQAGTGDQIDVDPGLGPLADNGGFTRTHRPGANAIDRGDPTACTGSDQRGRPRPVDGTGDGVARCDIGAVEWDGDAIFANGFEAPPWNSSLPGMSPRSR